MIQKVYKFCKPFVLTLMGIFGADFVNILAYIPFVPQDKAFMLCIPLYVGMLDFLLSELIDSIQTKYISQIDVFFSCNGVENGINGMPVIQFNEENLAEVEVTIKIFGRKADFKSKKLLINYIDFATMQLSGKNQHIASIDNEGNLIIDLETIFGGVTEKTHATTSFVVSFIQEPVDGVREIEMGAEFLGNQFSIKHRYV